MNKIKMTREELKTMIADYMEKGFLENIIDMFRHDGSLYSLVGELMTDERVRVRLGMSALVETFKKEAPENIEVTLIVNPEEAKRIITAMNQGGIELVVRNDKDEDSPIVIG